MDTFDLKWEVIKSLPIIYLDGSITLVAKQLLEKTYHEIVGQVKTKILIFDFTKIDYINSAGISFFLNILSIHDENSVELIFAGLSDQIKKVIDIVGLTDHVKVFEKIDMAIKYCNNE
jgi:anti-anti-sigma factor